jgi:hypothetical protein
MEQTMVRRCWQKIVKKKRGVFYEMGVYDREPNRMAGNA